MYYIYIDIQARMCYVYTYIVYYSRAVLISLRVRYLRLLFKGGYYIRVYTVAIYLFNAWRMSPLLL